MASVTYELYARCAAGFEGVLADELRTLGMTRVRPQVGGVSFAGRLRQAYEALMWSRVATRIELVVGRVSCTDAEALYAGVRGIAWEDIVAEGATVACRAHGTNAALRNTAFSALKVKDALCDRLREVRGSRPDVDARDPDLAIDVSVHPAKATVALNLSGPSLHLRGYRTEGSKTEAPLRETLAAGMLLAAGWPDIASAGGVLVDPFCGSGTFSVEAALIALDRAPGLLRTTWGLGGWLGHDEGIWRSVEEAARRRGDEGWSEALIVAGDIDEGAVAVARGCVERADVAGLCDIAVADACDLGARLRRLGVSDAPRGLMVANPPYGIRLGDADGLVGVRGVLAAAASALPEGWRIATISPDAGTDTALGRVAERTISCRNGSIPVRVGIYEVREASRSVVAVTSLGGVAREVGIASRASEQFSARLRKVARERLRRARREGVRCLRLYDADLPDYPYAIDLYEGDERRVAVVDEYPRPSSLDDWRADARLADACALVAAVLDLSEGDVRCHAWCRDGARERLAPRLLAVTEAGISVEVDLDGRPDTGLPPWLRGLRAHLLEAARGRRCAIVGGHAGLAGVFCAAGGARSVVVAEPFADRVELLETALTRGGLEARVVRADMRSALLREARAHHTFDLIVLAPPAWEGASGKTGEFELGRDHVALIAEAARLLSRGGRIVFCCREWGFSADVAGLEREGLTVTDLSGALVPWDCVRSRIRPTMLEVTRRA